ncbi:hypothetical protein ACXAT3_003876 [Clostridium sporogenes]
MKSSPYNSNSAVSWTLRQEKYTLKTANSHQKEVSMLLAMGNIAYSAKTSFVGCFKLIGKLQWMLSCVFWSFSFQGLTWTQ